MGRCTGRRCPAQVGYDVANCNQFECSYRTEATTNYDRIKSMSVEEMAKLFYGIIHERDLHIMTALKEKGIEASLLEALPEVHIAYHKRWLESEAE